MSSAELKEAATARSQGTDPATGRRRASLITGAASGMGLEASRLFSSKGFFVVAVDANVKGVGPDAMTGRSRPGLEDLQKELGEENVKACQLDVTNKAGFDALVKELEAELPAKCNSKVATLDVVFANAGIGRGGLWAEQNFQDHLDVINVNVLGVFTTIHTCFPLLKNGAPNSLAFSTSSSSAMYGMPGIVSYSASKHAVKGMTEGLSLEWRHYNMRAADALPGNIDTPILPGFEYPSTGPWRLISPKIVAEALWHSWVNDPDGKDALGNSTKDRIHFYVPEELQTDIDAVVNTVGGAEIIRDKYDNELALWNWIKTNYIAQQQKEQQGQK